MAELKLGFRENPSQLARRIEELKTSLGAVNPDMLAGRTGAVFAAGIAGSGEFQITYWGREIRISHPEFSAFESEGGQALDLMDQAMLAYYFSTSDGTPLPGRWISFSELPDGAFYTQAFQGYTGAELAKKFKNDLDGVARTATSLPGYLPEQGEPLGDAAFAFQALPNIRLLVACWLGDEDFPPSYRVLFDAAAGHHLTTDAYAIMGSMLTKKIINN